MTFGEKLQTLRRGAGMSQDALAEQLDVSRQAVSKWERDEALPETENLIRISQIFHVSLDELLLNEQPRQQPPRNATDSTFTEVKRTVRRHGYKLGYGLMILGAVICVFSILLRIAWPAIGQGFFRSVDSFDPFGQSGLVWEFDENLSDAEKAAIEKELGLSVEKELGMFFDDAATQQMSDMMSGALNAQANLFLLGLLPGGVLLIAGAVVVVKGKKAAEQAG